MGRAKPSQQDYDQLELLGIFHIAYGALAGLAGLFLLAYMCVVGLALAADSEPGSEVAGGLVVIVGVVISLFFFAKCAWMVFSGIGLRSHKWRTLSYVGAGFACINVPLGAALGVFTFVVLDRPGVRAIYEGFVAAPAAIRTVTATMPTPRKDTMQPASPLRVRIA
jgi:hypothetical protein